MNFKEYQKKAATTSQYPNILVVDHETDNGKVAGLAVNDSSYIYSALGLAGESGEVVEKIKKIVRNKKGIMSDKDKTDIAKELGDVLWYISDLATQLDLNLDTIAKGNIEKLFDRLKRNVIKSEGDNR